MALQITDVHEELAESARDFGKRFAPISKTRQQLGELQTGGSGEVWDAVVKQGLHAVHLPEQLGGMGGSAQDLAVVAGVSGEALFPGPLVPTVFASSVASESGADDALLARFAAGATGVVIEGEFELLEAGLTGVSSPAIGALAAEILIVLVGGSGNRSAYLVEARDAEVERLEAVDLARDLGRVTLANAPARHAGELSRGAYLALLGAVFGSEAAGVARAALAGAVDYATTREQFGVPIGSFQATKHKAARMAVSTELAASASWGAALSLAQDHEQQLLAGLAAVISSLRQAHSIVTDAVTIYGGIGFTWEHDVHLFLRRALSLAGLAGSADASAEQLGAASLEYERRVDIELVDDDPEFRRGICEILDRAAELPLNEPRFPGQNGTLYLDGPRRDYLVQHGIVAPHWPKPWGLEATPAQQVIIGQEYARRSLVQPTMVIGEWAVPTILQHGTEEQKERYTTPTLLGEIIWCQLFSEPEAGSDLASLRTRAEKVDGGWKLNGQKVWTSGAHHSNWGICLARTDTEVPKHRGLSFFIVKMDAPGVTVRPLTQSNAEDEFSEVFFDDVFVSDAELVGEPGDGWRISMTTLQNERTSISSTLSSGVDGGLREAIATRAGAHRQESVRAFGRVSALETAIGSLNLAETLRRLGGLQPGAGSSLGKVASAQLARVAAEVALDASGRETPLGNGPDAAVQHVLALPQDLIGGGTVEIQLNVIAERILGLPRL